MGAVGSIYVWVSILPQVSRHHLNYNGYNSWLAWTCDALDFFAVSLTTSLLSTQFNRPVATIVRPFHSSLPYAADGTT
jgi:hypothetical protein